MSDTSPSYRCSKATHHTHVTRSTHDHVHMQSHLLSFSSASCVSSSSSSSSSPPSSPHTASHHSHHAQPKQSISYVRMHVCECDITRHHMWHAHDPNNTQHQHDAKHSTPSTPSTLSTRHDKREQIMDVCERLTPCACVMMSHHVHVMMYPSQDGGICKLNYFANGPASCKLQHVHHAHGVA